MQSMALWHFKIELIPLERLCGRSQITADEYDGAGFWSERQPPENFRDRLSAISAPIESWHEDLLWFGEKEQDRIDVWFEGDRVKSITARVDCRGTKVEFVRQIVLLAADWSCALVEHRYLNVLPGTFDGLIAAIANSPNNRFMVDPEFWLPKLADEVSKGEKEVD
jgi:hypothetical protein